MKKIAAILALFTLCAVRARAVDLRLKDFPACPSVTSTTSIYVDRGVGVSSSERATPAQVCQAGATTTPAAGVVPKADGSGLLPAGFLPAATTSALGGVILATPSSDTTAGHAVQASDARVPPAPTDDAVPLGNGTAYQAKVLPNCPDSGGQHVNYTASTNTFSCGTSGDGGGAGTVTSVGLTVPAWLAVTGSPVTTSGTVAVSAATGQTPHRVIGTCGSATSFGVCQEGIADLASSTSADLRGALSDESGSGAALFGTSPTATDLTANQAANGDDAITSTRATDTSPIGNFLNFKNAAAASIWRVDITGSLAAGTVPVARVTGLAASATTDTTDATNISSGTLTVARGGTGTGSTLTGLVRGSGSAMTAAELSGDAVTSGSNAVTVGKINGVSLAGLATGILKNTTTTGIPSIAIAGDFPTLNQNTTGTAGGLSVTNDVAHGGTGATTLSAHGPLIGNGTGAVTVGGAGTAGQVWTSNGASADPTFQTPPAGDITAVLSSPVALSFETPGVVTGLTLTLPVGTYRVEAIVEGTGPAGANGGLQSNLGGSATTSYVLTGEARGHVLSDLSITSSAEIGDATASTSLTAGDTYRFFYVVIVKVTTSGTFGVLAARVSSSVNATTLSSGSMIIAHKLA